MLSDKRDLTADVIKICAVITAMPRWVGALLAAEGFALPKEWLWWWLPLSAIFSAGMAITEGLAFAYVFNAWRVQKDKSADRLLWLAVLSGAVFVIVLSPFIAAQVRAVTLANMLEERWALWAWSVGVAASTIVIVASVGYAQKRRETSHVKLPEIRPASKVAADKISPKRIPRSNSEFDQLLTVIHQQAGPEPFGQADVQRWTERGKTSAYALLGYGEEVGRIEQVGRGQYVYRNGVDK